MNRVRYTAFASVLALSAALSTGAAAQQMPRDVIETGVLPITMMVCELPVHHPDMSLLPAGHVHTPVHRGSGGASATFQVTYSGFTAPAQAAFQAALDVWATYIASSVPIKIQANWVVLGPNVLGSAGSNGLFLGFPNAPVPATWFANAMADAISGTDVGSGVELTANFNSNFANWYFGTDGNTPAGQFDLMAVVMHEVGHGLGFFGRGVVDDGNPSTGQGIECQGTINEGCYGVGGLPIIYERLVEDQAGVAMLDIPTYPNYSIPLGMLLRSTQLYSDGPTISATLGDRARLYAPAGFQYGSSFSHLAEAGYPAGSPNAMMTPQVAPGESFDNPGPAVCALFNDMGWPLGPDCLGLVTLPANEPGTVDEQASLEVTGPNPFAAGTSVTLSVRESGDVRVELIDVTGRVIAVVHDGAVAAGAPVELAVDAGSLPSGVYVVRAVGEGFTATRRLVHAR